MLPKKDGDEELMTETKKTEQGGYVDLQSPEPGN